MIVQKSYKKNTELSEETKKRISDAKNYPVTDEEDCPKYSLEQLQELYSHSRSVEKRLRETVSLRLDPETLKLAKAFGKGYTTIMGLVLYKAYRDPEFINSILEEYDLK